MTIALGFLYSGGVLVCADNQFTAGAAKLEGQKTSAFSASWGNVICAFAGNADYAAAAFMECEHLKETKDFKKDPVQALREVLERRYKSNVFGHPDYATGDYWYSLLIGIHQNGKPNPSLYKTADGTLRPLSACECIGIGEQFGRDVAKLLYSFKMDHARAVFTASYVLSHASARAQYVGDKFMFRGLNRDGSFIDNSERLELLALHAHNAGNWFVQECQRFFVLHAFGDAKSYARLSEILDTRTAFIRGLWNDLESGRQGLESPTVDPSRLPPWPE
jgi:20S proteasome alpha/beta subunit